eukprot:gene12823-biopygen23002
MIALRRAQAETCTARVRMRAPRWAPSWWMGQAGPRGSVLARSAAVPLRDCHKVSTHAPRAHVHGSWTRLLWLLARCGRSLFSERHALDPKVDGEHTGYGPQSGRTGAEQFRCSLIFRRSTRPFVPKLPSHQPLRVQASQARTRHSHDCGYLPPTRLVAAQKCRSFWKGRARISPDDPPSPGSPKAAKIRGAALTDFNPFPKKRKPARNPSLASQRHVRRIDVPSRHDKGKQQYHQGRSQ